MTVALPATPVLISPTPVTVATESTVHSHIVVYLVLPFLVFAISFGISYLIIKLWRRRYRVNQPDDVEAPKECIPRLVSSSAWGTDMPLKIDFTIAETDEGTMEHAEFEYFKVTEDIESQLPISRFQIDTVLEHPLQSVQVFSVSEPVVSTIPTLESMSASIGQWGESAVSVPAAVPLSVGGDLPVAISMVACVEEWGADSGEVSMSTTPTSQEEHREPSSTRPVNSKEPKVRVAAKIPSANNTRGNIDLKRSIAKSASSRVLTKITNVSRNKLPSSSAAPLQKTFSTRSFTKLSKASTGRTSPLPPRSSSTRVFPNVSGVSRNDTTSARIPRSKTAPLFTQAAIKSSDECQRTEKRSSRGDEGYRSATRSSKRKENVPPTRPTRSSLLK